MWEHVSNAISNARFEVEPWPYVRVENVFPDDFYPKILANLPVHEDMVPLGKSSTRFVYWLEARHQTIPMVPQFWEDLQEELYDRLWLALEDKLGVVGQRTGVEIVHDFPGYYLGPHTDTPDKAITCIFYLPRTDEDAKHGTVLFHGDAPDPLGKGHKFSPDYQPIKVIPYVPNTALFFKRTDWSFHGVRPTLAERWSLAFDVFH